jgi:copper chaperone CopZ
MTRSPGDRAQVASLGSLLLVAVVVISAGTFGAYYVTSVTGGAAGGADSVSLTIEATQDELRLSHNGGESVSGSGLRVTVENASGEVTYAFDAGVVRGGDGDGRLDAGEVWRLRWTQSPGTDVTVTVVDTGSDPDRLLLRDTTTVDRAATARPGSIAQGEAPTPTPAATSTPAPTPTPAPTSTPTPTPTDGDPSVSTVGFSDSDGQIDDAEANSNARRTVTVTYDEAMDQSVKPTVSVGGVTSSSATVDESTGQWVSSSSYTVDVTFSDNDVDTNFAFEVSGGVDEAGNTQEGTYTSGPYLIDTQLPGTPNSVDIQPDNINRGNVGTVAVAVTNPSTVRGDETVVATLTGSGGRVVTAQTPIDVSGDGTTTVSVDARSLAEGKVTAGAYLTDDVDNRGGELSDKDSTTKDTGRPVVTSVTVEDGPVINEAEATEASGQKVTVTFNESMDQSIDPTVTVTGLSGSPYTVDPASTGGFQSPTKWTGILDLNDDDEEATATIEVSGGVDLAGNTQSPDPDTSNTIEVDTRAPSISAFEATNPNGKKIEVKFESDERLSTISVEISKGGSVVKTLTADDFTESGSGPYTYTESYNPGGKAADYEVTLNEAKDAASNDGATGQSETVNTGNGNSGNNPGNSGNNPGNSGN